MKIIVLKLNDYDSFSVQLPYLWQMNSVIIAFKTVEILYLFIWVVVTMFKSYIFRKFKVYTWDLTFVYYVLIIYQ